VRVLVSALQVGPGQTGVGRFARDLIESLSKLPASLRRPREHEFVIAAPHPEAFGFLDGVEGFTVVPIPLLREDSWGRMLCLHTTIPRLGTRLAVDLVLVPNYIAPLWGSFATAVVVHDLTFVRFPETMPPLKRLYYRWMVGRSMRRADLVFVTTETMAREVVGYEPSALYKLRRMPGGASTSFLDPGGEEGEDESAGWKTPRHDFLFVGTLEPRKNLERLLVAHGRLCRFDPEFPGLKIVGGRGWEDEGIRRAMRAHPDPSRLHILGYLDEEELRRQYDESLALLFPSLYEGFGLPVLEAMARGCPVLSSRGIATAELVGDAALLVDPLDLGELEWAMRRLATDSALRERLRTAGRLRLRAFRWERGARLTMEALLGWWTARQEDPR